MFGQIDTIGKERSDARGWTWLSCLALAWIAGIVLAAQWPNRWVFYVAGLTALLASAGLYLRRRDAQAYAVGLVAFALVGGSWFIVQRDYVPADHVSRYVHDEPAIAGLRGTVASIPREVKPEQGSFGSFSFEKPCTMFELNIDAVDAGGGFEPASGRMLVRLKQHDHRPAPGSRELKACHALKQGQARRQPRDRGHSWKS